MLGECLSCVGGVSRWESGSRGITVFGGVLRPENGSTPFLPRPLTSTRLTTIVLSGEALTREIVG